MRFGPYELEERLAVGGMAEVFVGVRTGADGFRRKVVLKRILPQLAGDPEFQTLFADEARLGGLLHHPNIVQMFDYDRIDGVAYLAMEYVAGENLGTVLRRGPPLPVAASVAIGLAVLEGLGYAHALTEGGRALRIVHRDISPANILLSWDGQVKIADFGVARAETAAHETRAGELKGKLPYLSPEQVKSQPTDARSDLFSFGVVLYQMLTGSRPFDGDSEVQMLHRIAQGEFLPPRRVAPHLPRPLESVVLRALEVDPARRFQTAGETAEALRDAAGAAGVTASLDEVRKHLAKNFGGEPPGGDEPATLPAGARPWPVPDRTPSKPRPGAPAAAAEPGDLPTVVDRKSSTPPPAPPAPLASAATPAAPARDVTPPPAIPTRGPRARVIAAVVGAIVATALLAGIGTWLASRGGDGARQPDGGPAGGAAGASSGETVVVLRMTEQQEAWYLRELLRPWSAHRGREVRIVRFGDIPDLPRVLRDAGAVDLVKVPLPDARALVDAGLVRSLTRLANESGLPGGVTALTAGFDPRVMPLCEYPTIVGRELFYLPRKVEVRFLVYDVPAVRGAVAAFPALQARLEQDLRRLTGHGLPRGFALESDPEQWDWYDQLAVAYAMAHTPDAQGRTMPRVAHRTHPYWGTVGTFLDMLGELGQTDPSIGDTQQMRDLVAWEQLYRELGLYHPAVYSEEEVLSGRGLYEAMQRGEVYLTTTHSLGVRLLAGDAAEGVPGYLARDDDLGMATLPTGVSLDLGADGRPARVGTRGGFEDGWLWGIPTAAPDPRGSLELIRHITSREVARRETRAFLIEPVRTDVALDGSPLATRVADVVRRQHEFGGDRHVPRPSDAAELVRMRDGVHAVWRRLVAARRPGSGAIDMAAIERDLPAILAPGP